MWSAPRVCRRSVSRDTTLAISIEFGSTDGWEHEAACRGADASLFFGPNHFEPKKERLAREAAAKQLCDACPVSSQCRDHAFTVGEAYGVWGGVGESERRAILKESRKPARKAS